MASVDEYAAWRGVSAQRVRRLVRSGDLPAHRIGSRQWIIDDAAFVARPRLGPPMSPPMAWALIALLSGDSPNPELPTVRADRLAKNRIRLRDAGEQAPELLSSWLRMRGERLVFRAQPLDLADLLVDPRVLPSGISDPRSGLAAGDVAEVWLRNFFQLEEVQGDYLLLPDPKGNVVIHRGGPQQKGE
ncbi:MAG: helix-turn-helix domain-containing protein, partial [Pseudolysinimonas sp.]